MERMAAATMLVISTRVVCMTTAAGELVDELAQLRAAQKSAAEANRKSLAVAIATKECSDKRWAELQGQLADARAERAILQGQLADSREEIARWRAEAESTECRILNLRDRVKAEHGVWLREARELQEQVALEQSRAADRGLPLVTPDRGRLETPRRERPRGDTPPRRGRAAVRPGDGHAEPAHREPLARPGLGVPPFPRLGQCGSGVAPRTGEEFYIGEERSHVEMQTDQGMGFGGARNHVGTQTELAITAPVFSTHSGAGGHAEGDAATHSQELGAGDSGAEGPFGDRFHDRRHDRPCELLDAPVDGLQRGVRSKIRGRSGVRTIAGLRNPVATGFLTGFIAGHADSRLRPSTARRIQQARP
mmetsp:Transcript_82330/g.245515  ORF Transcript_82330/g.245515 Transcript_82330/m.245515 type:complete len:364 (-) Transcript_82330:198-1289(-)